MVEVVPRSSLNLFLKVLERKLGRRKENSLESVPVKGFRRGNFGFRLSYNLVRKSHVGTESEVKQMPSCWPKGQES